MTDKPDIPQTASIQTGNGHVNRLIPIHEGPNNEILTDINNLQISNECFDPPPIPDEEIGSIPQFPDLETPVQNFTSGVKFDPKSNMDSMKPVTPYNIIDLFWLINPRFNTSEIEENEAHFVVISFNINFSNLKITFHKIPNGAIQRNVLFLMSLYRLSSGTIYPSSVFKMVNSYRNIHKGELDEEEIEFTCLEQLFRNTGEDWQFNRPICKIKVNKSIKLIIDDPKIGSYFYEFDGWQLDALIHSCDFALKEGLLLSGQNNINSNLRRS